ncbi:MAG TPA: C39 family peptidase [Ktedonobacteraceae bacterium]
MPLLLITLLAVALIVTMIGFLLSSKPQVRSQRATTYPSMRNRRHAYNPVESVPLRTHRYSVEIEQTGAFSLSIPAIWERITGRSTGQQLPWRVIVIGLVSIFVVGFYSLNLLLPHPASFGQAWFLSGNNVATQQNPKVPNPPIYQASQSLVRLSQLDPAQYNTSQEYNLWAYSACSTAAMTEVMNAYGHHYRITDILRVESQLGDITPALGLLRDSGISDTVAKFGFKTDWGYKRSLDQIITIAKQGRPVIVGFPPARYAGGHLVVVTGGNSTVVNLADSSLYNRRSISRQQFMQWWEGFSAIVTPK